MKTLRETTATLRQPLGVLAILVGGCALLAAFSAVVLPALPTRVQSGAVDLLGGVPGLYRGLEMTREAPLPTGTLRLEVGERVVARFPATAEDWASGEFDLEGAGLPLLLAAWGALLGLVLHLLWFVNASRPVIGLALVLGVASGLAVAHTLPMVPRYWASFWLRGAAGLPGLEERLGSPVGIENLPSSAYLASLGGRVAEYPPEPPPWPSTAKVQISDRGRAWFAGYGVMAWLALLLVAAAARAKLFRWRVLVGGLGLGSGCWFLLPFLPSSIGLALGDAALGLSESASLALAPGLTLFETSRLGLSVGLALLPLLIAAWWVVLTPAGLVGWAVQALRSRYSRGARAAADGGAATPPESIPVLGQDEPDWLKDYEQRRSPDPEHGEPHPSPGDDAP